MNIVAVDTLGDVCTCCWLGDDKVYFEKEKSIHHANVIISLLKKLALRVGKKWHELDYICANVGPGSFTGIRVGLATCQGLSLPYEIPIVTFSNLKLQAYRHFVRGLLKSDNIFDNSMETSILKNILSRSYNSCQYLVALDAKMGQIYFGSFLLDKNGLLESSFIEVLSDPEDLPKHYVSDCKSIYRIGDAWSVYASRLDSFWDIGQLIEEDDDTRGFQAFAMCSMAYKGSLLGILKSIDAKDLQGNYLRDNVAEKPKKK